jgi:hypothetical protein
MSWRGRTRVRRPVPVEKLKQSAARTSFPRAAETVGLPSSGAPSCRADGASPLKVLEVDALREGAAMQADWDEEQHEFDHRQAEQRALLGIAERAISPVLISSRSRGA